MKVFDQIQINKPRSNVFDLSHEKKLTCDMGELIPFVCMDVIPGDKININAEILIRMQPMLAPVMHRVDVYTHFFKVPNRIIWDDWEEFITGGEDGLSTLQIPVLSMNDAFKQYFDKYGVGDYLGIPPMDQNQTPTVNAIVSILPFRAITKIYNDYYRDQNLEDELTYDISNITKIQQRAWEKDYFTSALPWAQRGGQVELPIGSSAPVEFTDDFSRLGRWYDPNQGQDSFAGNMSTDDNGLTLSAGQVNPIFYDPGTTLAADLSNATAITINDLRRATRLQEWLEKNARGGSRYIEQIFSHFGVRSSDARLQRPEYIGGGKQPIAISEVLSTVDTIDSGNEGSPQGNMSGHGISVGKSNHCSTYCEEHGFIVGLLSVMPRTSYQDGIPKHFLKRDKLDYYWPEFAQLGEQAVEQQELFYKSTAPIDLNATFGYQMRYSEYKYHPSSVAGDMRDSLDFYHFGRKFAASPNLNNDFVKANVTKRPFAVQSADYKSLIVQIYNQVKAVRPMPYFNNPTL